MYNDDVSLKSSERLSSDGFTQNGRGSTLKIGTWNVRTLYQAGKLDNVIMEMKRLDLDIIGISEARWTDSGSLDKDGYVFYFSGGQHHINGVGVIIKKKYEKSMQGYIPISDRVMMVKFEGKPFDIAVIQVYAPTEESSDEEVEKFYEDVVVVVTRGPPFSGTISSTSGSLLASEPDRLVPPDPGCFSSSSQHHIA